MNSIILPAGASSASKQQQQRRPSSGIARANCPKGVSEPVWLFLESLESHHKGSGPAYTRPGPDLTFYCKCPAHADTRASLSVSQGDKGQILIYCHAGCKTDNILTELHLSWPELMPPRRKAWFTPKPVGTPSTPAAEKKRKVYPTTTAMLQALDYGMSQDRFLRTTQYAYRDNAGIAIARVIRYERRAASGGKNEKEFRPCHKTEGGWSIGDPPGPWPLYRLPQIIAAVKARKRIYVVEGEKACNASVEIGLDCTTSAHGAKSPGKTDWAPLVGAVEVCILPDNDDAGRAYARQVVSIIHKVDPEISVKVVALPNLPEHGDIVDYIAARRKADPGGAS